MSLRNLPRHQDRDVRMHDPLHQTPHLNGNGPVSTAPPPSSNTIVSPTTSNGVAAPTTIVQKLATANESTWLLIGRVAEQMGDLEHALSAYENALRHNPTSLSGLTQVAGIARIKENYPKAVEFFQRVLTLQEENGEVWSALGHCYLMQDDLQKAYSAYQQALYLLPNPKEDPKLWYGIGILYDRYGSLDHAEEAFSSVLRMDQDLDFDKANEILFRLGIIYKQQSKYDESLKCFDRILRNPPNPLAHADIWFQIGHVYEQQKDYVRAKDAYERVVADNPSHAKVLQQLGWLYHQDGSSFQNQDLAIQYLTKSLEADSSDAQSWYLLGRAYMAGQKYNKAYEAYQQAVYRDGRNPTFWCSIGVLYFQINQFRDALDAYSRAIRINPYISEVWFDLGSLYESCNNQISDAIDAYHRASELDPSNTVISQRLQLLKTAQQTGGQLPAAPGPQDVHPTAYASAVVPPSGLNGAPLLLQPGGSRPSFRTESRGPGDISLPPPSHVGAGRSTPPFGGRPPPPVIIDESRMPSHPPLAPMEIDRPGHVRDLSRESARGPLGHQSLLLHHPVPEEARNGHHDSYFTRGPPRPHSSATRSMSPARARSPPPPFPPFPSSAGPRPPPMNNGPGHPSAVQRSPRSYPMHEPTPRPVESEGAWDRRPNPEHVRDWDARSTRGARHSGGEYPGGYPPPYPTRSPGPGSIRGPTPPETSPRSAHPSSSSRYRGEKLPGILTGRTSPAVSTSSRYDPRHEDHPMPEEVRRYRGDPERVRDFPFDLGHGDDMRRPPREERPQRMGLQPAEFSPEERRGLEERRAMDERRVLEERRAMEERRFEAPAAPSSRSSESPHPGDDRRRRSAEAKRKRPSGRMSREEGTETSSSVRPGMPMNAPYRSVYSKGGSPGPASSNGSGGSSRSVQPSPTSGAPRRNIDEDYDEGVAETLMGLAQSGPGNGYRAPERSPAGSRHSDPSPRPHPSHRDSVSSTRSHVSPALSNKRPLSPGFDEMSDAKRTRVEIRAAPSSRPSPIPFRQQPTSRSPQTSPPPLSAVALPPHPRPIGVGGAGIALPPIATLSSPEPDRDERMESPRNGVRGSPPKKTPSPPAAEKKESSS
ncbi:hypothetical protein CPB85DRAFT_1350123 [Mucidula mucida]|nr:hypothetical protein CPB85DRAFT_1350123 [Mucidula mucida]